MRSIAITQLSYEDLFEEPNMCTIFFVLSNARAGMEFRNFGAPVGEEEEVSDEVENGTFVIFSVEQTPKHTFAFH